MAILAIVTLLFNGISFTPVSAADIEFASITGTPVTSGTVGDTLRVIGNGFDAYAGTSLYIFIGTGTNRIPIAAPTVSGSPFIGTFNAQFTVPNLPGGPNLVTVHTDDFYHENNKIAEVTFIIIGLTIAPTTGEVGENVLFNGNGFSTGTSVPVQFDGTTVSTVTANSAGNISGSFIVPETANGSHTVRAEVSTGQYSSTTFTVIQSMTLSAVEGGVNDQITINGTGYAPTSQITIYWDGTLQDISGIQTNSNGSFTTELTIPQASRGSHIVRAQDNSGNSVEKTYTVGQKININPTNGSVDNTVTVSGTGFGTNQTISLSWDGNTLTTNPMSITSGTSGGFTATFTVPGSAGGDHTISASDGTYTATAVFKINLSATISQQTSAFNPGHVGMDITISGSGFLPSSTITIQFTSEPIVVATTTSDNNGTFSANFKVPEAEPGSHVISITDGINSEQFQFFMEGNAPIPPQLVEPVATSKPKQPVVFDWSDVEDASGVTYTLQISTDPNFSTLTLEKTDLTSSGYTMNEAEKLESVSTDNPYNWRVKVIDGTGTESEWSSTATFSVGFSFNFDWPSWAWWIIGGIGVVLMFLFGFWLGRRSVIY
jgi:hypothetical protein